MGNETETRRQGKQGSSTPETKQERELWLVDQLTALAEAFGESGDKVSPQRLEIYARALCDLDLGTLQRAFARAMCELKFFPKIAELRELAGTAAKDQRNVEAEAAWKFANDYLRKWGVDLLPVYRGGQRIEAPALPQRIVYALRRIGGLAGLNQVTEEKRPFMFKDFCEAYDLAPLADSLSPQFPAIEGQVKAQLTDGAKAGPREMKPAACAKPKPIPQPLTDAQRRERLEILRQQAQFVRSRDTSSRSAEPCNSAQQIPGPTHA